MKIKIDVVVQRMQSEPGLVYEGFVVQEGREGKSIKLGTVGDPHVLRQNVRRHLVREFGSDTVGEMEVNIHLPGLHGKGLDL